MSRSTEVFNLSQADDVDYLDFASESKSTTSTKPAAGKPAATIIAKTKKKAAYKPVRELPEDYCSDVGPSIVSVESRDKKIPLKNVQEHQLLINCLNAFAHSTRFAPILNEFGINIKDLSKKTLSELKELRERVRACCANCGSSGGIVSTAALSMCSGLEAAMPKRIMNLDGYRSQIESNPEFAALCEMIEIDSGFKTSMSPMQRMAMCLGTTAFSVAGANKIKAAAQDASASLLSSLKAQQQAAAVPALASRPAVVKEATEEGEKVRVY
jgi:hypothetical protein